MAGGLVVSVEDVQVQHIRIRVSGHGKLVGELEVIPQMSAKHLIVGEQRWWRPENLDDEEAAAFYEGVADRLWDEVIVLGDRLEASLSAVDAGVTGPERLRVRGFRQCGQLWFCERPRVRRGGVRGHR